MRVFGAAKCRPRREPAETELREILEHLAVAPAPSHHQADQEAAAE